MIDVLVIQAGRDALMMTLALAGPVLVIVLVVGLSIAIFQAVTQVNEMTLAYVPKILVTFGVLAVLGPWMLTMIVSYTSGLLNRLPEMVR
ncbi:MAG: flagellar biosynthesis protein FliQ [Dehalococcoidia bacterium]|nr:flagellar biosynthesis protein FliQ [Dehalococcoidia bacterium]